MPDFQLMSAFDFTDLDLEANQYGEITLRQRDRLKKTTEAKISKLVLPILGLSFGYCGVITIVAVVLRFLSRSQPLLNLRYEGGWYWQICWLTVAGIIVAILSILTTNHWLVWSDLRGGKVETITGQAHLTNLTKRNSVTGSKSEHLALWVQQQSFEITWEQNAVLTDSASYRVYYVPKSRQILSIENVSADKAAALNRWSLNQENPHL